MNEGGSQDRNPLRKVWGILSVPMSALGLLGLSDSLITFNQNIQNLINSYKAITHPVFELIFFWVWFDIPTYVFDYLFVGIIFVSCELRVWGFIKVHENLLKHYLSSIKDIAFGVVFWPAISAEMAYQVLRSDSKGNITSLEKNTQPFYVKYNFRNRDILVFRYIASAFLLFLIVVIINYAYFMNHA